MNDTTRINSDLIKEISVLKKRIQNLEESKEKYRLAFDSTSDGIFTIDRNLNISSITPSVERQLGFKVEEVINRPIQDLNILTSESLTRAVSDVIQVLSGAEVTGAVYEFIAKDGTRKIGEVTGTPIIREGKILGVTAVVRDITERKRAEEEIQSLARFPSENPNPVLRIARDGTLLYINQAGLSLLPEWHLQVGQSVPSMLKDVVSEALNSKSPLLLDLEQRERVYSFFITPIANGGYTNMYGRDITDRKRAEEALRESEQRYHELSIVDDLTQLYNSRHFYHQLKIELDRSNRYKQPLTILLLDLDNFKAFNDTYGHIEGDQVLRRLGQVVKRCLRETDFAFRYGGEEFTILLPMTTREEGAVTAERIRLGFKKETFSLTPNRDVHMTVSIGLAQYRPQEEMKAFIHRADQLMYQGKKNGKDRVCRES